MQPAPPVVALGHKPYAKRGQLFSTARRQRIDAAIRAQNGEPPAPPIDDMLDLNRQFNGLNVVQLPWRPRNVKNFMRLNEPPPPDGSTCLAPDSEDLKYADPLEQDRLWRGFSQFQVYCTTNTTSAEQALPRMQWPLLMRFFDNWKVPGYAVVLSQGNSTLRYYGESYWIGWEIPYWMSLPPFLLDDDAKCKLTLYWIARQRRYYDLMPFDKLSVMICTYFPSAKLLQDRRRDGNQLWCFQGDLNRGIPGNRPVHELLADPVERSRFVYQLNGGKGADLAKNKNIPLSFILSNPNPPDQQIRTDRWLEEGFPDVDRLGRPTGQPGTWHWSDTFSGVKGHESFRNNPHVLDAFLGYHNQEVLRILEQYGDALRMFINANDPAQMADMFTGVDFGLADARPSADQLQNQRDLQLLMAMKQQWVQRYGGNVEEIVRDEQRNLAQDVLYSSTVDEVRRYNSGSAQVPVWAS
jgi:hypothetical protein